MVAMAKPVSVSVIIVTWNSSRDIEVCLRSIPAALGGLLGETIIVDNGSSDATAALIESLSRTMSMVAILRNSKNLGFSGANNLAIRSAQGKYILLLNPDTQLQPNAIARLVTCLNTSNAGMVGAHHRNANGSTQPSVRSFPTLRAMLLLLLKAHHYAPTLPALTAYFAKNFDYEKTQPADQLAGSCLLVSRSVIKQIGGLDERLNIWFEDVDWCKRAHAAGIGVWYCGNSEVFHLGGQSFAQLSTLSRQRQFNRSLRYYMKKHHCIAAWLAVTALNPVSLALAIFGTKNRPQQRPN